MNDKLKNLKIREGGDSDSDSISDLIFDIWINEYKFNVNKQEFPDLRYIDKSYRHSGGLFLVAVIDKQVIGTIAYEKLGEGDFVLKRMFVHRNYRKKGVAQQLLDSLISDLKARYGENSISIYLSTKESDALAAKLFYRKNQFHVITKSDLPVNFPFFYKDDLFMSIKLP
jgi:ribosomal protein S18 acetylase RimI-like enzyme